MTDSLVSKVSSQRQEIKSDRMDMSFGEIINMYKDGEILISPEYQRAFRWDAQRQTDFIESILLGIPFPSIFVATNEDGKWELIDGLQRVSTVLSFFGELNDDTKNNLTLLSGNIIQELKDVSIDNLPLELKLSIKRTACRVEIIQKESNFQMRYELFKRLNTGGEGLTRQEIRNCIYRGFKEYKYFNSKLVTAANNRDFRRIVAISEEQTEKKLYEELVLRFFSLYNFRLDYTERAIQDFFDKVMKNQSKAPNKTMIDATFKKFAEVFKFLSNIPDKENVFKLARLSFSTSMYDSITLTLALTEKPLNALDPIEFIAKTNNLKNDKGFQRHAGSASSNSTSINSKLVIAQKILLGEDNEC